MFDSRTPQWLSATAHRPRTELTAISLFSGLGGLDIGLQCAGFAVRLAVECDPVAVETIEANKLFPVARYAGATARIEELSSGELLSQAGCSASEVDLIVGGPPCQPFSMAAYWSNGGSEPLRDPRARTLREFFRVVRDIRPRVFLLENVQGFAFEGRTKALEYVRQEIKSINRSRGTEYRLDLAVLNAADYGVPQTRKRLFLVGHTKPEAFRFPLATHAAAGNGLEPWIRSWDVLWDLDGTPSDLLALAGKWADLVPSIPEGRNYLHHTARGGGKPLFGWRTKYWSFLLKLARHRPSWTLQSLPGPASGPFHWLNRRLSARELGRLQTIPDRIGLPPNIKEAQRLLGNAVPSLMGEVMGREIRTQLLGCEGSQELTLLPQRTSRPIPPLATKTVPRKYWDLRGVHAPHPGTGLGPNAVRRRRAAEEREAALLQPRAG